MKKTILAAFLISFLSTTTAQASLLQDIWVGVKEYKSKDYTSALKSLNNYINSNPNDPQGYFWLGKTYTALNDTKRAQETFKQCYELTKKDKNIAKISFEESSALEDYFDMALSYFEAGNFSEASFYADLMLRLEAKSPSAYFIKAKVAQIEGNLESATEYLNYAITYNPKLLETNLAKSLNITRLPSPKKETYNVLATEAYFRGDILSSIDNLKKYIRLNPQDAEAYSSLADLYIKNSDYLSANQAINSALKINPNNLSAYLNLAKIYETTNNKKLEETLLKAYKINPNNKEALLKLANYYLSKNDFYNSKKYFEILTNINDTLYEAYFGYIYSLIELGEFEEASKCFKTKMSRFKQKNGEAEFLLARLCIQAQEYNQAIEYLNQALKKEDNMHYRAEIERVNELSKLDKRE